MQTYGYSFGFGPWNIQPGADPFGPAVRPTVAFADILHSELDPFDDGSKCIYLSGPRVEISSRLAVALGMAIHELTTNAAKYGALSVYGGNVAVRWAVTIEARRRTLEFITSLYKSALTGQPVRRGSITSDDPFYHAMNGQPERA